METEEKIVYAILEVVNKGVVLEDSKVDERLVRELVKAYRASVLVKYTLNGYILPDECFQSLGLVKYTKVKGREYSANLPKMIRTSDNFGIYFRISGEDFGVISSENYFLGLKNVISKRLPKAKIEGSLASIYIGDPLNSTPKKPLNNLILEALHANATLNKFDFINVETFGILDDTSLGKNYDWTSSPYPMPSELIDEMKTRLLVKEFNIIAQSNPDKTTDGNDKGSIGGNSQQQQEQ